MRILSISWSEMSKIGDVIRYIHCYGAFILFEEILKILHFFFAWMQSLLAKPVMIGVMAFFWLLREHTLKHVNDTHQYLFALVLLSHRRAQSKQQMISCRCRPDLAQNTVGQLLVLW